MTQAENQMAAGIAQAFQTEQQRSIEVTEHNEQTSRQWRAALHAPREE